MHLYLIICSANGKLYVGITSRSVRERFAEHLAEARQGKKRPLLNAIRKYGAECFSVHEVLAAETWESLCEHEKELIALLNTKPPFGYNVTDGGDGVVGLSSDLRSLIALKNKGRKHTLETKRKISESSRGRKHTDESRRKLSEAHKGKKLSDQHKLKLSRAHKGKKMKPRTKEHASKISEGLRRSWARRKGEVE